MQIVRKELSPGIVTLELKGPLQMGVECKRLEIAVDELLQEKRTRVVLDLSGVSKLDSGGFRLLKLTRRPSREIGKQGRSHITPIGSCRNLD